LLSCVYVLNLRVIYRNWDCRKLRRVNLPIFRSEQLIRTAQVAFTFVNRQQKASHLSLVYMFSIDRIKFYSEWKRCENRLRVNNFLRKPSKVLDFGWHHVLVTGTVFSQLNAEGHSFKSRPRRPGIYSNLAFIQSPAFIYWMYFSSIHFLSSVLEVYWIENQTWNNVMNFYLISQNLVCHLSKNITDRNSDWTFLNFLFLRETRRKCIGNCSTANVLSKQFRASWWRAGGSRSISSEKGKIWRDSRKL